MKVIIIAGVSDNGVIGKANALPWHIPEDLKRFKKLTLGKPVIMGRKTYESIFARLGKPLPERKSIVITSQNLKVPEDVETAGDVEGALRIAKKYGKKIYVIGGAGIYQQFIKATDALEITEIHKEFQGDVYFPKIDWQEWKEIKRKDHEEGELKYSFVTYERKKDD